MNNYLTGRLFKKINQPDQAIFHLEIEANNGHVESQFELGELYILRNAKQGLEWFKKSADNGFVKSQMKLAKIYKKGLYISFDIRGVRVNLYESFKWFSKAARLNNAEAIYNIARMYRLELGVHVDTKKAMKLYHKSSKMGYAHAQYKLGRIYCKGIEIKKNNIKAIEWLNKAVDQGHILAHNDLATLLINSGDMGVLDRAVALLQIGVKHGNPTSLYNLGRLYKFGRGVPQDEKKYMELLKKAVDGLAIARNELDEMRKKNHNYLTGKLFNKLKHYDQAKIHFEDSIEEGHAKSPYELARMYWYALGVEKDHVKSVELFSKSADRDYGVAKFQLAAIYSDRYCGFKDYDKANELYIELGNKGCIESQLEIADRYNQGLKGIIKNYSEGLKWFQKAAELGDSTGQLHIGIRYYRDKNYKEAKKWLTLAANQGNVQSKDLLLKMASPEKYLQSLIGIKEI